MCNFTLLYISNYTSMYTMYIYIYTHVFGFNVSENQRSEYGMDAVTGNRRLWPHPPARPFSITTSLWFSPLDLFLPGPVSSCNHDPFGLWHLPVGAFTRVLWTSGVEMILSNCQAQAMQYMPHYAAFSLVVIKSSFLISRLSSDPGHHI